MSDKDPQQTLIPRDDDEQWQKVLRGEIEMDAENDTHREAREIREYILSTEIIAAEQSVPPSHALNTITQEEARVEYRRASTEIHKQANTGWQRWLTYGLVSLFGLMAGLIAFFAANYFASSEGNQNRAAFSSNGTRINSQEFGDQYKVINGGKAAGRYPNMLPIPAGQFIMGCRNGWDDIAGGCRENEYPSHKVSIKSFELAQHEVTVGQFRHFVDDTSYQTIAEANTGCVIAEPNSPSPRWIMDKASNWLSPGFEQDDTHPVVCIARDDALAYIKWLNKKTAKQYRLPTEAEWEYAARAGTATPHHWGNRADHNQANFKGVNGLDIWEHTAAVGSFPANKFNIQDMAGNAWEWVADCWHDNYVSAPADGSVWDSNCNGSEYITRRGGAWDASDLSIRSSYRSHAGGTDRSQGYGFRVAHDLK